MIGPGTVLDGRYRIDRRQALGGMSEVFVAHDLVLDRDVAVKVLRGETADRRRFETEVALLAKLQHPSLVQVLDAAEHEDEPFVVMVLVEGRTLAEVLRDGPVDDDTLVHVATDLADALAYLHVQGVVHRDVKPSNILIGDDGRARLTDFGVARLVDASRVTTTGVAIGTPAYMAPEQLRGRAAGPPADVYALGLVLGECLSGSPVFPGHGPEAALARLDHDPDFRAAPPAWHDLLTAMTERDPNARPTAATVRDRLLEWSDATLVPSSAVEAPTQQMVTAPRRTARAAATEVLTPPPVVEPIAPVGAGPQPRRPSGLAVLAAIALLVLVVALAIAHPWASDSGNLAAPGVTSSSTTAPTTTAPPSTAPALDCAALQQQRAALDLQSQQISKTLTGPQRDAAMRQLDAQKRALDAQLRACH
jgi:serine/threonine protein kinase